VSSPPQKFLASSYSSTSKAAVAQQFVWQAASTGNNTASPSANLELLFGQGAATPAATGLSVASNGQITFAPGQKFPSSGTGTITGVTAGTGLTGGGTTGDVTLTVNSKVVPELAAENAFTGPNDFTIGLTASSSTPGGSAMSAYGTKGADGVYITSDTGIAGFFLNSTTENAAVYAVNNGTGDPGLAIAVKGYVPHAGSIAVLGKADGAASTGVDGEDVGGEDSTGVYAYATGAGSNALYAKAVGGADGNGNIGSGVVGNSANGDGVIGYSLGSSATGRSLASNSAYFGVWGDSGSAGGAETAGIAGTADNTYAGIFQNNGQSPTIVVNNTGKSGPAGVFYSGISDSYTIYVQNTGNAYAAEMANYSATYPTLYLSNNSGGPITDGIFNSLMASTPAGTCGIGGNGDLSCTGQVKSLVSAGNGARKVETYAVQSPENWIEDFGSGEMVRGVAVVKIDLAFAETVTADTSYHVFLTPKGDSKGLYVINETAASFEVRESGGGTSSLSFDYRIVAKRRGYETERLKDVTESYNAAKDATERQPRPSPAPQIRKNPAEPKTPQIPKTAELAVTAAEPAAHLASSPDAKPHR
jgi:hypothetical protein